MAQVNYFRSHSMGPKGTLRAIEAAERRAERDAQKRQRELERRAKEEAKLSELEQARLEVERYENRIEVLLSIHKEQGKTWDWAGILASLPPILPQRNSQNELRAKQLLAVLPLNQREARGVTFEQAQTEDDRMFQQAMESYSLEVLDREHLRELGRRVLDGDPKAYTEALTECGAFGEIAELGSSIHVTVHGPKFLECVVGVNGQQVIPAQTKTLTATGKLSIKGMPKGRFQEIYADYLCGCAFRVAREVFAVLPVDLLLVTASADSIDPKTGHEAEKPVLSVVFPRSKISQLNFDHLDPSAAIEQYQHRAKFSGGRKSEPFEAVMPISSAEVVHEESITFDQMTVKGQRLLSELQAKILELRREPIVEIPEPETTP
jgi:hypothetical protein